MWILKYMECLRHGHDFANYTYRNMTYRYCLHCGEVKPPGHVHLKLKTITVPVNTQNDDMLEYSNNFKADDR